MARSAIKLTRDQRWMIGIWREGDRVLTLRARVSDLAAFRERLSWLRKVDASPLSQR